MPRRSLVLIPILALAMVGRAQTCLPSEPRTDLASQLATLVAGLEPGLMASSVTGASFEAQVVTEFVAGGAEGDDVGALEALVALANGYDRPLPAGLGAADDPLDSDAIGDWLAAAAGEVHTQAFLVTATREREAVRHAAVHWNSPLVPRLRVVRLPEDRVRPGNRDDVLDLLGTCAVAVDEWVSAPEPVVATFLRDHLETFMLVTARDASGAAVERWVPPERMLDALRFEDPVTEDLSAFDAWFAGEGPGILAVTRLLPSLRSSLGPGDLLALFRAARQR